MGEVVNLLVATPSRGELHPAYLSTVLHLAALCAERRIGFATLHDGSSPCSVARDSCLAAFLADDWFTHLLFLDDDTAVKVQQIMRLLDSTHPFCAVAYRKKLTGELHEYVVASREWPEPGPDGFVQIDRVGTGCMLITKPMVRDMMTKFPELAYPTVTGPRPGLFREVYPSLQDGVDRGEVFVSEDYSFCDRARATGYKLQVLLDAVSSHHGQSEWVGNLAEHWPQIRAHEQLHPRPAGKMTAFRTAKVPPPSAR